MRRQSLAIATLTTALVTGAAAAPAAAGNAPEMGLVAWMGRLQYYAHKLGLAVSAQNRDLQGYYVHEVEEVIEQLEDIDESDGIEVAKLVKANLVPAFETLEGAVEIGDQARVDVAYEGLLAACNTCHKAANRPYIRIVRRTDNPYIQDFATLP